MPKVCRVGCGVDPTLPPPARFGACRWTGHKHCSITAIPIFKKLPYNPHHTLTLKSRMQHERFGRLVVQSLASTDAHYRKRWTCLCDCGNAKVVLQDKLKAGTTKSCGCFQQEFVKALVDKAAEERRGPTHSSWQAMIGRCTNPKYPSYPKYGGNGIEVCDRWRYGENGKTGWICFYEDMGPRPANTTIDRIDGALGYFLENCRWATHDQQIANRTNVGRPKKLLA